MSDDRSASGRPPTLQTEEPASLQVTNLLQLVPKDVLTICRRLRDAGLRAWIVGGCTRDLLLQRDVHDWDVATEAKPHEVQRLFRRVIPTGMKHGTVTVMMGLEAYEVTTLRGEGAYSDGRHPDSVTFVLDIHEDLARRDFTMNAIALDPVSGRLEDPFGGQRDLRDRCIRAVGDPHERFTEDGLRVLRAARFSAVLGFDIEPRTLQAIPAALDTLRKVSAERVRDELLKTLAAPTPSRGLRAMQTTRVFEAILPELLPMVGCEQNRHHRFDVWEHTIRVVDACPSDPILRLAALLHDLGKPATRAHSDKTNDYTFYQHEVVGAELADRVCSRLRLSNDDRIRAVEVVRHHLVVYDETWSDAAVRRWVRRVGEERTDDILAIARADALGKGVEADEQLARIDGLRSRRAELAARGMVLRVRDLVIGGRDLIEALELRPGPIIGRILDHLLELVLDDPTVNEKEKLVEAARIFAADAPDRGPPEGGSAPPPVSRPTTPTTGL